jgi:pimeloyl-ACP methyl ester carboxylesterase
MKTPPLAYEASAGGFSLSCLFHEGGDRAAVFLHGLGAAKESFSSAFEHEGLLASCTMLAPDLPGFGDSPKPEDFSYTMKDLAGIAAELAARLVPGRFHLVAHSMGGIVGIELCERMPGRVLSFINVEGNVTAEDCTISRRIIEWSEDEFVHGGFEELRRDLGGKFERAGHEAGTRYLAMMERASARAVHRSSASTVHESDSGDLFERFARLELPTCYVYGELSRGLYPAEARLHARGIPVFYVSGSGHSPMDENPEEFYGLVLELLEGKQP